MNGMDTFLKPVLAVKDMTGNNQKRTKQKMSKMDTINKKITEIIIRKDLYPRQEEDLSKIVTYSENLEVLPPILINQDNILIDGLHRLKAHQHAKKEDILVEVEKTENDNQIFLRAIETNSTHGLQLSNKDKQSIAVRLFDGKNRDRLLKSLSVSDRTFRNWTANKARQLEDERNDEIMRLFLRCFTQEEIAEKTGEPRQTITDIIQKLKENAENGKIAEIGKAFKPFLYTIWSLPKINNEVKHFGAFPMEYMESLLYYHTKPFEVVYDPFAGGGTTIDACKKWYRRYYVSDLNPIEIRKDDINKWDINTGLPKELPVPDLVFLDPPYWKQAQGEYSKQKEDLGNLELKDFYSVFQNLGKNLNKKMRVGGRVAFVIMPSQYNNTNREYEDHTIRMINIFEGAGFGLKMRYVLPYSTEQYNAQQVTLMKNEKKCMVIHRDLVILEKIE